MKKILAILIVCSLLGGFSYYFFYLSVTTLKIDEPFYFYDKDILVKKDKGRVLLDEKQDVLEAEKLKIELQGQPIYLQKSNALITTAHSSIVNFQSGQSNKISAFSQIEVKDDGIYLKGVERPLQDSILFDGKDTYMVLERTMLNLGMNQIELSPLSYVKFINDDNDMYIYNKDADTFSTEYIRDTPVQIQSDFGYEIDLRTDLLKNQNGEQLLFRDVKTLGEYK